jgi:fucose 4-O-acetylase-like acetyltransferase
MTARIASSAAGILDTRTTTRAAPRARPDRSLEVIPPAHPRYHALDALRAVMMLLGIYLHAAISYSQRGFAGVWPYHDPARSWVADWTTTVIHVFRMPVFFVMAGLFAALLYSRRGPGSMIRNRALRIALPFALFWILLMPPLYAGLAFALGTRETGLGAGWDAAVSTLLGLGYYRDSTAHLWFLYDLLYFYAAAMALARAVRCTPDRWRRSLLSLFERVLVSPFRVPAFALVTAGTLTLTPRGMLHTSISFVPDPGLLLVYFVFFGFGWLVYLRRDRLDVFKRGAWRWTLIGLGLAVASAALTLGFLESLEGPARLACVVATSSLAVWALVFGLTGLFLRYLDRPSPTVRYIVDSSYWMYLIHLPLTLWVPGLLARVDVPALVKIAVVLVVITPLMLVSYDLLVRPTILGVLLSGRRFPRGLPTLDAGGAPVTTPAVATAG